MIEYREITAYEGSVVQAGDQYREKLGSDWLEVTPSLYGTKYNEYELDFDDFEYRRPIADATDTKPIIDNLMGDVKGQLDGLSIGSGLMDACANNESDIDTSNKNIEFVKDMILKCDEMNSEWLRALADAKGQDKPDYNMDIHSNPDHTAWAKFYIETWPNGCKDEDTMAGWFANAMMAKADSMAQDKPQEWVDGLPPVGVECEISSCGNDWERCRINYMGLSLCVVDHLKLKDQHYHLSSVEFRPLKSAEQLEAEKEESRRQEITKQIMSAIGYYRGMYETDVGYIVDHLIDTGRLTDKGDV